MKEFGVLMITTSLPSYMYMNQVSSTASIATVGELTSSFEMKSHCIFLLAIVIPLIFPSLFSLRNIWEYKTSALTLLLRADSCLGSNVFWRWSCLIYYFIESLAFFPHCFRPDLSEICVIIVDTTIGCYSTAWLKNTCVCGFNIPCFSICAVAVLYFKPFMDGM